MEDTITRIGKDNRAPPCSISRRLLPVKGVYFTFLAGIGDLLLFIPVYMRQVGLSSTETGIIYGIMPFIAFFVRPLFGAFADKSRRHKLVLMFCCIMTGVTHCSLLLTPVKEMNSRDTKSLQLSEQCRNSIISRNNTLTLKIEVNQLEKRELSEPELYTSRDSIIRCNLSYEVRDTQLKICTDGLNLFDIEKHICEFEERKTRKEVMTSSLSNESVVLQKQMSLPLGNHDGFVCETFDLERGWSYVKNGLFGCNVTVISDCETVCMENTLMFEDSAAFGWTFWCFFVIYLLCNVFFSPVLSLIDAIAYDILGEDGRANWGKQRLWGTAGVAIFAVASTFIMDAISSTQTDINYKFSFYIFLCLNILTAIIAYFLEYSEKLQCNMLFKSLSTLLKHTEIVAFLFLMTMVGIFNAVIEAFLFWYLKDLGSSQIILGLCIVFSCVPEIIMLQFAGRLTMFVGYVPSFCVSLAAYAVRFFAYSFLTNPWYVLLIEPLQALSFALMYSTATAYANTITPPGMSATVQGLVGGLIFGFGKGIGCIITGKLFDPQSGLGAVWTFRLYGFVTCVTLLVYSMLHLLVFKKQKRGQENMADEGKAGQIN